MAHYLGSEEVKWKGFLCVMPGQKRVFALDVPGIHVLSPTEAKYVDGRVKPGHDE